MKDAKDIYGQSFEADTIRAVQLLESSICEGFLSSKRGESLLPLNVFGRPVRLFQSHNTGFLHGLLTTGLRGAAILPGTGLNTNKPQLSWIRRQNLPAVIHVFNDRLEESLAQTGDLPGFFQIQSANPQESVDFALIAHKIAEYSLCPGIHRMHPPYSPGSLSFPDEDLLRKFIGQADDQILCPSPAQEIIFGKHRRRIPNWFNFDVPVLQGVRKTGRPSTLEAVAREQYFYRHLPDITEQIFEEFSSLTGREYHTLQTHHIQKADYLILAQGSIYPKVVEAAHHLRTVEKLRVGCLHLNVLHPFPEAAIRPLLHGIKAITILEPIDGQSPGKSFIFNTLQLLLEKEGRGKTGLYHGQYGEDHTPASIMQVFRNMTKGGAGKKNFYLGIDFTFSSSKLPYQEILQQRIRRAYPALEALSLNTEKPPADNNVETGAGTDLPLAVRRYQDQGPPYSRLSRFYNDTAYFFRQGKNSGLVADPFQALPLSPPATANFSPNTTGREFSPVFYPEQCTACGDCFVYCPHSAIPPLAIGMESFIKGAINIANQKGMPVSRLVSMARSLAKMAGQTIGQNKKPINKVSDFLPEAFEKMIQQVNPPEEKRNTLQSEFEIINDITGEFPVAITESLYRQNELRKNGSGLLFSLAIDPNGCTACGLCAGICPEEAILMEPHTDERLQQQSRQFKLWEQLPDTAGDTISQLQQEPPYNPFAATLLSRNFYLSMSGGAGPEKGVPGKSLLHLVTALTESIVQPRINTQLKEIESLTDELSKNIHQLLSKSLPTGDLEGIAGAISKLESPRVSLNELVEKLGPQHYPNLLDAAALHRKIDLYQQLQELQHTLSVGPTGTGRARYGLVLATSEFPWLESFPYHSFMVPTLFQSDQGTPEVAQGLIAGHLRHVLDNLRLLRRATLEAKNKYLPEKHDPVIAALDWNSLEETEKSLIPPILLLGGYQQVAGEDFVSLNRLLESGWPVKIVLTDQADAPPAASPKGDPMVSLLASRKAFVLQSGMGNFRHFFDGALKALYSSQPALLRLFTMTDANENHWPEQTKLAWQSRTFPHFQFEPDSARDFLSAGISLGGNPSPDQEWHLIQLNHAEEGQPGGKAYSLTPADWLHTQPSWQPEFRKFHPEEGTAVPVSEYLKLDQAAKEGKVPIILSPAREDNAEKIAVSGKVLAFVEARMRYWNNLRELGGRIIPFPQKLRNETEAGLKVKYEDQIAQIRKEYEEKLATQEKRLMEETKIKLREKLLALSRSKKVH